MMKFVDCPSPNFGPRKDGKKIGMIVLHYTDTVDDFEALRLMQDPQHQASAHYLIDERGHITRLVPEELRAWHAGKSYWAEETDINSVSVGIEIQNPGHSHGYVVFPPKQIEATINLCKEIMVRHEVPACHVVGHSDVAPIRKTDPGEYFPWKVLAENGVGLWPNIDAIDSAGAEEIVKNEEEIKLLLKAYGYDTKVDFKTLVTAFQRHFEQDIFKTPQKVGIPTRNTVLILKALLEQKRALNIKWPSI